MTSKYDYVISASFPSGLNILNIDYKLKNDVTLSTYYLYQSLGDNMISFVFSQSINQIDLDNFIAAYDPSVLVFKSVGKQLQITPQFTRFNIRDVYQRVATFEFDPNVNNNIHSVNIITNCINSPSFMFQLLDATHNTVLGTSSTINNASDEVSVTLTDIASLPTDSNSNVELHIKLTNLTGGKTVDISNVIFNFIEYQY